MSLKARLKGKYHGNDGLKASKRIADLEQTLKVIHTWTHPYLSDVLTIAQIHRLAEQALERK